MRKSYLITLVLVALSSDAIADERSKAWDAASRAEYKVQQEVTKCNAGDCRGLKKALKAADRAQDAVERVERKHQK
mgnify:CR=1 FL=1